MDPEVLSVLRARLQTECEGFLTRLLAELGEPSPAAASVPGSQWSARWSCPRIITARHLLPGDAGLLREGVP